MTESGVVIVFNQATPAVVFYDQQGQLFRSWGNRFPGAHGMTLVKEGDTEYLWLVDSVTGEVVKTTLDGRTVQQIEKPQIEIYEKGGKYAPTWVAVNEERFGGNGDIWVTDGYGSNILHRYDKTGRYIDWYGGKNGNPEFKCPHGIWIDQRKAEPELYIADRGNHRVQVYNMDGQLKRIFGDDILTSPCGFNAAGKYLLVPELKARIAILDENDELVCYLGENDGIYDLEGWPNHPKALIHAGLFNSPHGIAADHDGNIYVTEWIIGGRITKLAQTTTKETQMV